MDKVVVALFHHLEHFRGLVGGGIVNYDDLEIGILLVEELGKVAKQSIRLVVGVQNDRDWRLGYGKDRRAFTFAIAAIDGSSPNDEPKQELDEPDYYNAYGCINEPLRV
jgi:hypothetical protein